MLLLIVTSWEANTHTKLPERSSIPLCYRLSCVASKLFVSASPCFVGPQWWSNPPGVVNFEADGSTMLRLAAVSDWAAPWTHTSGPDSCKPC